MQGRKIIYSEREITLQPFCLEIEQSVKLQGSGLRLQRTAIYLDAPGLREACRQSKTISSREQRRQPCRDRGMGKLHASVHAESNPLPVV